MCSLCCSTIPPICILHHLLIPAKQNGLCPLSDTFLHKSCSRRWPSRRITIAARSGICPRKHKNVFKADVSMQWEHTEIITPASWSSRASNSWRQKLTWQYYSAEHISFLECIVFLTLFFSLTLFFFWNRMFCWSILIRNMGADCLHRNFPAPCWLWVLVGIFCWTQTTSKCSTDYRLID